MSAVRSPAQPEGPVLLGHVLADALAGIGKADVRAGRPATCRACGDPAHWHRTTQGRWVLIQPGDVPHHLVPAGQRWHIAGDGTAVNLGRAAPDDTCRITHFAVCPLGAPPQAPYLLRLWRHGAARLGRLT
ncbi:DUF6083 domain-containing protein [Streptomyces sp. NBC_01565]|nr:DUF6083 domain-containing protein [Streptomyces sp. NBC_01565]MCX4541634.1 DUF6083 domain-containing protein [Streptomyces sp. NBC_01565]